MPRGGFRERKKLFLRRFSRDMEMKRPRNWGNCEASKAAIEVWVFGGEQPPKRINCIGGESISLPLNIHWLLCRVESNFYSHPAVPKYYVVGAIIRLLDCGFSVFFDHF